MARLLVQRQLGHKPAKHVHAFELMDSFAGPGLGKGSYRADRGYEWQAGICSKGCTPP
jgi:DMSO/TMAO reductase YedYZ molybdopterin-dependent catalytic subunit